MAEQRRVVITGIGAVTPIGISREAMWNGLRAQRSAVREVSRFDSSLFKSRIAAGHSEIVPSPLQEGFDPCARGR